MEAQNGNVRRDVLMRELSNIFATSRPITYGENDANNFVNNIGSLLDAKEGDVPAFSNDDLNAIFTKLRSPETKQKIQELFSADRELVDSIKKIRNDQSVSQDFKRIVNDIEQGLMKLQYNLLLSVCNTHKGDPPMSKLIIAINNKIRALNEFNQSRPESQQYKKAYDIIGIGSENIINNPVAQAGGHDFDHDYDDTDEYYRKKYLKYKSKYVLAKK